MAQPETPSAGHLTEEDSVLAALGEAPTPAVEQHLLACASCEAELERWRRLVTTVREGEEVRAAPLPAGAWEAVRRATGLTDDVPRPDLTVVGAAPVADLRPARPLPRWLPIAAALLVGAGLGAGVVSALRSQPAPEPAVASAQLAPLASTGAGSATVREVDGHQELDVSVRGVSAAPRGVLEVWLLDAKGGLLAVGTMAGEELSVALPTDVDLTRFATVDVSREPLDGNPGHSSDSVLRGTLAADA